MPILQKKIYNERMKQEKIYKRRFCNTCNELRRFEYDKKENIWICIYCERKEKLYY